MCAASQLISEVLSPEALASLLNEYFTPMTKIVLDSGGLLDKYIGDALMAVWGAPLAMDDHADKALESALKMLDALDVLREGWKPRSLPAIDIGCGINTGPMVVGNMGSDLTLRLYGTGRFGEPGVAPRRHHERVWGENCMLWADQKIAQEP